MGALRRNCFENAGYIGRHSRPYLPGRPFKGVGGLGLPRADGQRDWLRQNVRAFIQPMWTDKADGGYAGDETGKALTHNNGMSMADPAPFNGGSGLIYTGSNATIYAASSDYRVTNGVAYLCEVVLKLSSHSGTTNDYTISLGGMNDSYTDANDGFSFNIVASTGVWDVFYSNASNTFSNLPGGPAVSIGALTYLALYYDGSGNVKLYVNGSLAVSKADGLNTSPLNSWLRIGSSTAGNGAAFNGTLYMLRITKGITRDVASAIPTRPWPWR